MEQFDLRSSRLWLSPPTADDIGAIVRYCQDPLFEQFLTTPWPYTHRDAVFFVDEVVAGRWTTGEEFTWGIRAPDGALLGMIGWRTRGDVGYWLGEEHRGRGYMVEALTTVCDWVFADAGTGDGAEIVEWETSLGNLASARVARAAGFRYTGVAPHIVPERDGSHPDGWHAVLRREDDREVKYGWPL